MRIRKLFTFENAHIVRNCSSDRCKYSIHGHSYKVEVLLEANGLDNGHMVYDFGLMKGYIKDFIDSFDHSITLWDKDNEEYTLDMKFHSDRWVSLPVSPSAEQFARVFFFVIDKILKNTFMNNGEQDVGLHSVIVHETATGYAQAFYRDVYTEGLGISCLKLEDIVFSKAVVADWKRPNMMEDLIKGSPFNNPTVQIQVKE